MIKHEDFIKNGWEETSDETVYYSPRGGNTYYLAEFKDLPNDIQKEADEEAKKHKGDYFKFDIKGEHGETYKFSFNKTYCEIKTNLYYLIEREYLKNGIYLKVHYRGLSHVQVHDSDDYDNPYINPSSYRELVLSMKMREIEKREAILADLEEELDKAKDRLGRIMKL